MSTFHAAAKWFEQVGRDPNFQMIPTGSHLAGQCRLGLAFGGYRQGRQTLAVIWLPRQSVSAFHTAAQNGGPSWVFTSTRDAKSNLPSFSATQDRLDADCFYSFWSRKWWRRGESNPCPEMYPTHELVHMLSQDCFSQDDPTVPTHVFPWCQPLQDSALSRDALAAYPHHPNGLYFCLLVIVSVSQVRHQPVIRLRA